MKRKRFGNAFMKQEKIWECIYETGKDLEMYL